MASDHDPASPPRDYGSPAPSHIGRSIKGIQASSVKEEGYDSDQTRSASPTGSYATLPPQPPKTSAPAMRVNALLNDDAPTPPPAAASTPAPASKGPGRGNWGHRRKENQIAAANAAAAQRPVEEQTPGLAARPHGYYIPLNGQIVEPKRSRPLTVHQQAVERYRMENVNYILDRGLRDAHVKAKRRRTKDHSDMARAWKRCRALPDMYDSEEEVNAPVPAPIPGAPEAMAAARALVMMASLKPCHWEINDWGEEAANLAGGIRKVRRRTERWDSGATVVRKRDAPELPIQDEYDDMDVDDAMERSSLPDRDEDDDEMDYDGDEMEYGNGHRGVPIIA
jgi:Ino eighty subunit 1